MIATSVEKPSHYRSDLQGLRAIGAFLVAIFHIWFGRVSGGVDVFFVVSGYLITGSLYKEVQRSQTINVIAFWWRIAKRLAPLAYIVLAATWCAAWLWLPETLWKGFIKELRHSALSIENIKLMMDSVDYLDRSNIPSAVQQFWALSIQVQFYAVWPFLILACASVAKRIRSTRKALIVGLGLVLLASFAYSVITTRQAPAFAYFDPAARIWEFTLGGFVAILLPHLAIPEKVRLIAGWIGLAAIVSCGFILPATVKFPGYAALLPTSGAVLILLAGGGGLRLGIERVLGYRPLSALGELSFAFYLWHWPVLVFVLLITGRTEAGVVDGMLVIAISLSLAYLTDRFLRQPLFSTALLVSVLRPQKAVVAAMSTLLAAGLWGALAKASPKQSEKKLLPYDVTALQLAPQAAKKDLPRSYRENCHQIKHLADPLICAYGEAENPLRTIALVGGSHSAHWLPALHKLGMQHGWRIVTITKDACPLTTDSRVITACKEWNKAVMEHLEKLRPDAVFTTSTRPTNAGILKDKASIGQVGRPHEHVPSSYMDQWARLENMGIKVIAIRDTPWMRFNVPQCLNGVPSEWDDCTRLRHEILDESNPVDRLPSRPANVDFIDLTDKLCTDRICPPVKDNMIIYRDTNHLTATFSRSLSKALGQRIKEVRPDLFVMESQYKIPASGNSDYASNAKMGL